MVFLLLGVAAAGLVVLLVYVSGSSMPDHYESLYSCHISASPEEVFETLQGVAERPIAGKQCRRVTDVEREGERITWVEDLGQSRVTYRTTDAQRPVRLVRHGVDSVVPATFEQALSLEPAGSGTRLISTTRTIILDGTWHVPIFRFMLTMLDGANRANKDYLKRTARALGDDLELDA